MTPISSLSTQSQTTPPAVQAQAGETQNAADSLASDFDTFLQLLTTQLKNQDPSKPFDSTEFVGQLASFSAVEQQIATNAKLDSLIGALNGDAAANLAPWIGKEVLSDAPAQFSGSPMPVHYALPKDATSASVLVYDDSGTLVNRIAVMPGSTQADWDGLALDGSVMPFGTYSFSVESHNGTEKLETVTAQTFSTVVEARLDNNDAQVVFADGSKLSVAQIIAVRGSA